MIVLRTIASTVLLLGAVSCGLMSGEEGPRSQNDVCAIFAERPEWREAARKSARKWSAPVEVQMAIIWRESSFRARAKTPRTYFVGIIPTGRISSAYGYAQAIDGTWDWYRRDTGNSSARRADFGDATDFIGWYMSKTAHSNGIQMADAYNQYLNYHEGHAGFRSGRWRKKSWLRNAAEAVSAQAKRYRHQLKRCA